MDNENIRQIASLTKAIHLKLEEIRHVTSIEQLVAVFQELVMKLVQFSSKVHRIKQISTDELQKRTLKTLLRSIKESVPELSQACKETLKNNNYDVCQRKDHIIKTLAHTVQVAKNTVKKQVMSDDLQAEFSSWKHAVQDNDYSSCRKPDSQLFSDTDSSISTPLSTSESTAISEPLGFAECKSFKPGNDSSGGLYFQSLALNYREISKQMKEIFDDQGIFLKAEKSTKQDFGKKLLHDIDEFISMAKAFAPNLVRKCDEFHELGLDFVSMFMDYSYSEMPQDDFQILLNVQRHLEKYLRDIIATVEKPLGKEGSLISNEVEARGIIDEMSDFVVKRNFIGLADATVLFADKCEDSKMILKEIVGTNFQEQFQRFERKFKKELPEIECILNELLEDIEDRAILQMLISKMQNMMVLQSSFRDLLRSKPYDKAQNGAMFGKELPKISTKEEDSDGENSDVSLLVHQFSKAIDDNDYKMIEILANRFLSNIKLIGELLQGITHHLIRDIRDIRHLFAKYFKAAGRFCSTARKLVLSDVDRETCIGSLITVGKEMEIAALNFAQGCELSLQFWFDIPYSCQHGNSKEASNKKHVFLTITKRLKNIIETLSDTEHMEQEGMKSKLAKLSNVITKTTDSLTSSQMIQERDGRPGTGYLLEIYGLQWMFAALNILEIVDKVSVECLNYYPSSMKEEELHGIIQTWLSMLQTLSLCCTDAEGLKEISNITEQLTSISKKIEMKQNPEEVNGGVEFAITRRELFVNILLTMELTDILTQSVREPMRGYIDPLASLSFAPSLQSYKAIRDSFRDKMDTVHTMSCLAVQDSFFRAKAHLGFVAADELKEISQNLISTIESSDNNLKQKVSFLKLRWRLAATHLIKALLTVPEANYTAVAGVMRHLQSTSHSTRFDELVDVLKDIGSKKGFCKDNWKLKIEHSPRSIFADEISTDFNGSILDYPDFGDATILTASPSRIDPQEASFFRNYSASLKEDPAPPLPLLQTPDTFHSQSSYSSIRSSSSSRDTEIFIPKAVPINPKGDTDQIKNRTAERVPFRGWEPSSTEGADGSIIVRNESKISQSISAAAHILLRELEEWEEDGNSIITVVKTMTKQMLDMADYTKGKGELRSKEDFINTAKAIAANAQLVVKFAIIIADHCLDETCQLNLLHYAEIVPTLSTQLNIIASVKAATPNDETADAMLIANAENLMRSVSGTLRAAESASVKMKSDSGTRGGEPMSSTAALAIKWKKKLDFRRSMESITAPTNELGLKIIRDDSSWSLTDL